MKKIIILLTLIICFIIVGTVDGGTQAGIYPEKRSATVEIVVTLDDGNQYVVESNSKNVTVNTYNSPDPADWEIRNYK